MSHYFFTCCTYIVNSRDKEFAKTGHLIAVHPNDNTATVYLKAEDLIDIIKEHGNQVEVITL